MVASRQVHVAVCVPTQIGGCHKNAVTCVEEAPAAGQLDHDDVGEAGKKDKHPVRLLTLFVVEPGERAMQRASVTVAGMVTANSSTAVLYKQHSILFPDVVGPLTALSVPSSVRLHRAQWAVCRGTHQAEMAYIFDDMAASTASPMIASAAVTSHLSCTVLVLWQVPIKILWRHGRTWKRI